MPGGRAPSALQSGKAIIVLLACNSTSLLTVLTGLQRCSLRVIFPQVDGHLDPSEYQGDGPGPSLSRPGHGNEPAAGVMLAGVPPRADQPAILPSVSTFHQGLTTIESDRATPNVEATLHPKPSSVDTVFASFHEKESRQAAAWRDELDTADGTRFDG
jgi:hypothetical protein